METIYQNVVTALMLGIAAAIGVYMRGVASAGVKYIEMKLGVQETEKLRTYASTVVHFLEQSPIFKDMASMEKKERAICEVISFCEKNGIPIDHEMIDKIIEEAVHLMKEIK